MLGSSTKQKNNSRIVQVPIARILPNPKQPRKHFDQETLLELANSIRQNGILQPLTVRINEQGDFQLIAGERRLRAALLAGLSQVPCIVLEVDDSQSSVLALLENIQRQDLNFFEEAEGIAKLIETWSMTQEQLAAKLGKTQSTVANKIRLLKIKPADRETIISAGLTERHARALLKLNDQDRAGALKEIIRRGLTVSETEKMIESLLQPRKDIKIRKPTPIVKDIRIFINTFSNAVNVMKRAGIDAVAIAKDYDDYLEYTVRIPKTAGRTRMA